MLKNTKIKTGLITNDSIAGTEEFIRTNNFEKIFHFLWTAENHPSKPDPNAVIGLCLAMDLKPSECALISDADTDLEMATKANIGVVLGFTGGWKMPPLLHESDFLMNNWDELEIHQTP